MVPSFLRGAFFVVLIGTALMVPASRSRPVPSAGDPASPQGARREKARPEPAPGAPVQTEMRNVDYHASAAVLLNIRRLRGEMHSKRPGRAPVFEDKESFYLKIRSAEIAMSAESLAGLLNKHVFAYPDSPLERLQITIEPDRIIQKGILRKVVKIPFSIVGAMSLTPEGELRVHPTSIRVAGVGVRGLMKTLGLRMDKILKLDPDRGVRVVDNDLLLSPNRLLPPPNRSAPNYMYYEGGVLAFGKLTMTGTELQIVDADPRDPFDFFLDHYNEQLVAAYDQNLPDKGLIVHMPDYNKLGKAGAGRDKPRIASIAPGPQS